MTWQRNEIFSCMIECSLPQEICTWPSFPVIVERNAGADTHLAINMEEYFVLLTYPIDAISVHVTTWRVGLTVCIINILEQSLVQL